MNYLIIFYILGFVIKIEGILLLFPTVAGLIYGEKEFFSFLICAVGCLLIGGLATLKKPKNQVFFAKEGFVTVALSWIVVSIFGAIPFVLNGDIPRFTDAFFETASGFTTTGASILTNVEALSHASLFWRSFTHWIGGMGILVFLLSLLPIAGGATMHLMRAESPGPQVGKIVPKIKDTALILYIIYSVLTVLEMIILICGKMPVFDAITLSLGTAGTGGFAVKNTGLAEYSAFSQYVIAIFMIMFGINFNAYFLIMKKRFKDAFRVEEVRWYLGIIIFSVAVITLNTLGAFETVEEAFRHALFQVGSLITTTGFSTIDYNAFYPAICKIFVVILMFCGACAGSTGGGTKVSRIVILAKSVRAEISRIVHPNAVKKVRFEGKPVEELVLRSISLYFAAYLFIFVSSLIIISFDNFDFTTNFTAVLSAFNNIGPGLSKVGPAGNFSEFSNLSKYVLSFDMIAGRLEIFPMLILLSPATWRRSAILRKHKKAAQ